MISKDELLKWSEYWKPILFDLNLALRNLEIIEGKNGTVFMEKYYEPCGTLLFQQRFVLIIQLSKFFSQSKNQKFRSSKLFESVIDSDGFQESVERLTNLVSENATTIQEVNLLRDKVIAHTDSDGEVKYIETSKLRVLVELANDIYNSIIACGIEGELFNLAMITPHDFNKFVIALSK
ncbi:hypothetical protein WSM22_03560 [Cytophagales bacterium WSM2-2]|nr:hypothetical protein WSM22_03560 [Cytophagales bacterium WSM2-2]